MLILRWFRNAEPCRDPEFVNVIISVPGIFLQVSPPMILLLMWIPILLGDPHIKALCAAARMESAEQRQSESMTPASDQGAEADKLEVNPASAVASKSVTDAETPVSAAQLRSANIERCLAIYYTKPIDADRLRPWSIMHGLIAYGRQAQVFHQGRPINAVEHLCKNGAGDNMQLLGIENGKLVARMGPGVQGHPGQFLAILAQCNVPIDQPLLVDNRSFTLKDLLEYEQKTCHVGTELTFKLIAMAHYLEPDAHWTNEFGEQWDMQRLIREELTYPVSTGACGGTHRLMAYTFAVAQLANRGWPIGGEWHNAARMLNVYQDQAWRLQNPDGGFSTDFFERLDNNPDPGRRLYATGHILEWLVCTLPVEKLDDPRLTAAVDYTLNLMLNAPNYELDVGPRGHALHALAVYENRLHGRSSEYGQLLATGMPYAPAIKALTRDSETARSIGNIHSTTLNNNNGISRPTRRAVFRRR